MTFDPATRKVSLLRQKYNDLGTDDQSRFRELTMMGCEISVTTFYEWMDAPEKISKPHRYFISRLLNEDPRLIFKNEE